MSAPYQSRGSVFLLVTRVTSVGSRDLQCSSEMAVVDDAARRLYLHREVDSDLVYIWEDSGVSLAHQYELGQAYKTVRKFAALADSKVDARAAFGADLGLDPAKGPFHERRWRDWLQHGRLQMKPMRRMCRTVLKQKIWEFQDL